MSTLRALYDALVSSPANTKIEIDIDTERSAETLRCRLVNMVSAYRRALDAVGVPEINQPQSVKFVYDSKTKIATVWLGAKTVKPPRNISFRVITPTDEADNG